MEVGDGEEHGLLDDSLEGLTKHQELSGCLDQLWLEE